MERQFLVGLGGGRGREGEQRTASIVVVGSVGRRVIDRRRKRRRRRRRRDELNWSLSLVIHRHERQERNYWLYTASSLPHINNIHICMYVVVCCVL